MEQRLVEALKAKKRVASHLRQVWGLNKKPPHKEIVQRTETKPPELTGVDRYILAKK